MKQRLLGAAVLIALAIIFVPMFFSGTPPKTDGTTTQNLNIPPAPERNFETRNLSVDPPKPGAVPTPAPGTPPAAPSSAAGDKVATVDTGAPASFEAPDSATRPAPAAKPTGAATAAAAPAPAPPVPAPAPPAVSAEGRYLVNLGVYADAGHAGALVDKIRKLGYPAFAEATEYQGKAAQRVRVGPYAERAAAENVRLKIKQTDAKLPSSIVQTADPDKPSEKPADKPADKAVANAAKPAAAKPAAAEPATPAPTLPANRAGAYVVQAGAFKAEDEANKLRDRLRNGGVAAYVEKSSDGETTFWKVRAGPYADRGGADAAVTTLKQKFQVAAIVKTQP
ncbi:MAG: SPOR domain-containing protein [Proteobacteria bacterium]|nr:SPOR domain-containing protein [Pseudomonadota bacterium]